MFLWLTTIASLFFPLSGETWRRLSSQSNRCHRYFTFNSWQSRLQICFSRTHPAASCEFQWDKSILLQQRVIQPEMGLFISAFDSMSPLLMRGIRSSGLVYVFYPGTYRLPEPRPNNMHPGYVWARTKSQQDIWKQHHQQLSASARLTNTDGLILTKRRVCLEKSGTELQVEAVRLRAPTTGFISSSLSRSEICLLIKESTASLSGVFWLCRFGLWAFPSVHWLYRVCFIRS